MKKMVLGYIYGERNLGKDEKAFIKIAKRKNVELVMFNIAKNIDEENLEEKAKRCDIIFNNSGDEFAFEIIKTFEALGKKVIDSSRTYYYPEDKWIFSIECKRNKIPIPRTILLSENISKARKELKDFNNWPVILKRVSGTWGQYVEKADTVEEAEVIMKKFWGKGKERLPIIAQQFIRSPSYRVTLIKGKVVQTALKEIKDGSQQASMKKNLKNLE